MRRSYFLFLTAILFLPGFLSAQSPALSWVTQWSASGYYTAMHQAMCDNAGNVIVTGSFSGTVDFDPGPGVSTTTANDTFNTFIAKYDSSGNFVWVRNIGSCNSNWTGMLLKDASDNLYFVNTTNQLSDIAPGSQIFIPGISAFHNVFIAKYDPAGNFLWAVNDFGGNSAQFVQSTAIHPNGTTAVFFRFAGTFDADPGAGSVLFTAGTSGSGLLAVYDAAGSLLWAKQYDDSASSQLDVGDMEFTANGTLVLTGRIIGTVDADGGPGLEMLTAAGSDDPFLLAYSLSGIFRWAFVLNGPDVDESYHLVSDAQGDLYIGGTSTDSLLDFDPSPSVQRPPNMPPPWYGYSWIASYDSTGNFRWARSTAEVRYMELDPWGEITVNGTGYPLQDMDPGPSGVTLPGDMCGNPCLYKLSAAGDFRGVVAWSGVHVVSANVAQHCYSSTGRLYMAGNLYDTTDFAFGNDVYQRIPAAQGNYDFVIASYRASNDILSGIETATSSAGSFLLYPSPATTRLTVELPPEMAHQTVTLSIYSVDGKKQNSALFRDATRVELDISSLEAGVYLLEVTDGISLRVEKFIVSGR